MSKKNYYKYWARGIDESLGYKDWRENAVIWGVVGIIFILGLIIYIKYG